MLYVRKFAAFPQSSRTSSMDVPKPKTTEQDDDGEKEDELELMLLFGANVVVVVVVVRPHNGWARDSNSRTILSHPAT